MSLVPGNGPFVPIGHTVSVMHLRNRNEVRDIPLTRIASSDWSRLSLYLVGWAKIYVEMETDSTVEGCGKLLLACAKEIDRLLLFVGKYSVKERREKTAKGEWIKLARNMRTGKMEMQSQTKSRSTVNSI